MPTYLGGYHSESDMPDYISAWGNSSSQSNPNSFAASASRDNLTALPGIAQITQLINSINLTAQQASNAGRIPNGRGLESISSGGIGQALRGQLPQDVINLIGQQAAERGVMTGSPMGPGSNASFLRSLGRTSLDMMGTGQNWLTQANARNPGAPLFDPSSMFITPSQYGSLEMERLRLPRSGGSSGSVGGFPTTMGTSTAGSPGMGVNWADLFGGGGEGQIDNSFAPWGSLDFSHPYNTPSWNNAQDASTFFDPFSNTLGANPFP